MRSTSASSCPGPIPLQRTGRPSSTGCPSNRCRHRPIYPGQINTIINVANKAHHTQMANLILFVCEGGFRFQELQFLQVGDVNLSEREIILEVKKPDLQRVRPELRKRCLSPDGLWISKSRAARRPIHIADRTARLIGRMGLGEPPDWLFVKETGNRIAEKKTLQRLKGYALEADVLVAPHPRTGKPWSLIKWHWLRHPPPYAGVRFEDSA